LKSEAIKMGGNVATCKDVAKFQAEETQKWGRVIKAAGIEPE
jgi:hypothetical protein